MSRLPNPDSGKQSEEEAKWAKKTMQQGVLRKESVSVGL
jgi:hypothetical protein